MKQIHILMAALVGLVVGFGGGYVAGGGIEEVGTTNEPRDTILEDGGNNESNLPQDTNDSETTYLTPTGDIEPYTLEVSPYIDNRTYGFRGYLTSPWNVYTTIDDPDDLLLPLISWGKPLNGAPELTVHILPFDGESTALGYGPFSTPKDILTRDIDLIPTEANNYGNQTPGVANFSERRPDGREVTSTFVYGKNVALVSERPYRDNPDLPYYDLADIRIWFTNIEFSQPATLSDIE